MNFRSKTESVHEIQFFCPFYKKDRQRAILSTSVREWDYQAGCNACRTHTLTHSVPSKLARNQISQMSFRYEDSLDLCWERHGALRTSGVQATSSRSEKKSMQPLSLIKFATRGGKRESCNHIHYSYSLPC